GAPRELARVIRECLAPTGFVFTAPGEFLPDEAGELHLEERGGVTYYRRGLRKVKANPPHRSKKQRAGRDAVPRPETLAEADAALPRRERDLLSAAADELAANRPEAALALVKEAMFNALDDNRPSPVAWAMAAEIEFALGRPETAEAINEALHGLMAG
ncbi:MAG: hypothetical protein LBV79_06455, partial [Candidatus Adiutrix sp.]|nr:hypothetical protein [Candidatus Adiutrix sp.]